MEHDREQRGAECAGDALDHVQRPGRTWDLRLLEVLVGGGHRRRDRRAEARADQKQRGLEAFERELLRSVRERPAGEAVIDAFGRFVLAPRGLLAASDEQSARELLAVGRMIAASPALLAREEQIFARYTRALAQLIADEVRAPEGDLRPYVTASAPIGVHRALLGYVRAQLVSESLDRERLSREVRRRGQAALELLRRGIGAYSPER